MLTERKTLLLFILESLSLGTIVWQSIHFNGSLVSEMPFAAAALSLLAVWVLAFLFLCGVSLLYSRWLMSFAGQSRPLSFRALSITLIPLLFLLLDLFRRFIFLKELRGTLIAVSILGIFYLQYSYLIKIRRHSPADPDRGKKPFRPLAGLIFSLSLFIYVLYCSGLIFEPQPLTGDEPHYLIIAQSLVDDGDINIRNNYESRDYMSFYPGSLDFHRRPGKKGDAFHYSRHTPALPLLLAPFYKAAEKIAGLKRETFVLVVRLPMCLMSALLSLFVYLSALRLTGNRKTSLSVWAVFSFFPPVLFYSHLIYPEIPAALILILIFYHLILSQKTAPLRLFFAGAGIAFLPWLGIKYTVLTATVFLILFFTWWKNEKKKGFRILALMGPPALSGFFYLTFLWSLYGSLSPFSLYQKTTPDVNYNASSFFHFRIADFFRCASGYLFDQRAGFIAYAPVYLLVFGGLILAWKSRKSGVLPAVLLFGSYWAFCSLGYYWGGYCPPGRALLPVLWAGGLLLAWVMPQKNETVVLLRRGVIALSLLLTSLCLLNPWLLYHDQLGNAESKAGVQSLLLSDLSNSFVDFRRWIPALSSTEYFYWPTLVVWILAASALTAAVVILRKPRAEITPQRALNRQIAPVLLVISVVVAYTFFDVRIENGRTYGKAGYRIFFQDGNAYDEEKEGGFWVKGKGKTSVIISTPEPVEAIAVHSSSPVMRETSIRAGASEKRTVRKYPGEDTRVFTSPAGFPWKGEYLYSVRIAEKEGFTPFQIDSRVRDNRFLGVFIRIEVIHQ